MERYGRVARVSENDRRIMKKQFKVVWLCHLSNNEIQDILHPWKKMPEFAPWIFSCIKVIEQNPLFELHVVSPFYYIGWTHEFVLRGVYYHFYNPYLPLIGHPGLCFKGKHLYEYTNFRKSKRKVTSIVNRIHPDIIHLFGAENPYYSAAILPLVALYPTILTIQGFISHTKTTITPSVAKRIDIEKRVICNVPVCFYRSKTQAKYVLEINPHMELLPHMFCSYELKYENLPTDKLYDLVFFAAIKKDKGIVDIIKAVQIIKGWKSDVSLCVIGGGNIEQFVEFAKSLGVSNNIKWTGFLPTREDVHKMAAQCRISVLPTYNDMYPGTIIESMFLGIPMVSYEVDSNPEINENYEAIRLVKVGDVESLAKCIYELLSDKEQLQKLGEAGKRRAYEMFAPSNKTMVEQWVSGYNLSIDIFKGSSN